MAKEIEKPKVEKEEDKDDKTKRTGLTKVTSVSVSNEFAKIIKDHNLSPTEVFRKGLGVVLFDLGIENYQSEINRQRSEYVKKFYNEIQDEENKQALFDNLVELSEKVLEINRQIQRLKEFEGEDDKNNN